MAGCTGQTVEQLVQTLFSLFGSDQNSFDFNDSVIRILHNLILYDREKHPLVLPVDQLGEDLGAVKEMIAAHLPQAAVRFKKG